MSKAVPNGSTDVTTYFVLRDSTNHAPKADVTVTDIDIYYQEAGAAQAAKADLTALAAADSAHADNKGYHCGNSVYRIDWPDAAFDGGVGKEVILIVVCAGCDTIYQRVLLSPPVNVITIEGSDATDQIRDAVVDDATRIDASALNTASGRIQGDITTTILGRIDAAVSTRAPESDGNIAAIKAKTDNLPASPAATGAQMDLVNAPNTTALGAIADKVLGRTLAGGADGGRTVRQALRALRNRVAFGAKMTVYREDDSTTDWEAAFTTNAAAEPITEIDPD